MEGASEQNEQFIIATIARMNPPTPGHLLLIQMMILEAARKGLRQIFIILSHTMDDKKNPLDCWIKRDILLHPSITRMKESLARSNPGRNIENIDVEIICMNDEDVIEYTGSIGVFPSLRYLLHRFYNWPETRDKLTLQLFIGDDREGSYDFINEGLKRLVKHQEVEIEKTILKRPSMDESASIDRLRSLTSEQVSEIPLQSMSATLVRTLVKHGLREHFTEIMKRAYLNPVEIQELWSELVDILGSEKQTATEGHAEVLRHSIDPLKKVKPTKSQKDPKKKKQLRGGNRKYTKRKSNKRKSNKRKSI